MGEGDKKCENQVTCEEPMMEPILGPGASGEEQREADLLASLSFTLGRHLPQPLPSFCGDTPALAVLWKL